MMSTTTPDTSKSQLQGQRVALLGKLSSMSKRDAQQIVRQHGGTVVEKLDASATLVVVGEEELPLGDISGSEEWLDNDIRAAADEGRLEIISETELWKRLGMFDDGDDEPGVRRLYTSAMLANLLDVSTAVIRRWQRRGLITPVREVRRLAYFDYHEVTNARRLAQLLAEGISPATLEKKLADLARFLPDAQRRLAQLSVIVEGKQLLLRQGDGLLDPGGQFRFDFEADEPDAERNASIAEATIPLTATTDKSAAVTAGTGTAAGEPSTLEMPGTSQELLQAAAAYEDEEELDVAAATYRMMMATDGPSPEVNFRLAELLYRMGDAGAARERYYMAIELDEDFVEARANLGCVLSELGQRDLAVAAFEGALAYHHDYADAHYHLARALDDLARHEEAENHWHAFIQLAPDSPWAMEAAARLSPTDDD